MGGRLTTHVLDIGRGRPAAGVGIEVRRVDSDGGEDVLLKSVQTNQDGRTGEPLLAEGEFEAGTYEIVFEVGDYFRAIGATTETPAFLERVPVRFVVTNADGHYHIPLLVSPWAYSTYRGS